jgi:hypothetical protein
MPSGVCDGEEVVIGASYADQRWGWRFGQSSIIDRGFCPDKRRMLAPASSAGAKKNLTKARPKARKRAMSDRRLCWHILLPGAEKEFVAGASQVTIHGDE